jgi:hypothetical protein
MNSCSNNIQNLHSNHAFLKGAIMRICVMAMLLLSVVGCGSIGENNPEYPALKVLKTERDSVKSGIHVTLQLARNAYTKDLFYLAINDTPLIKIQNKHWYGWSEPGEKGTRIDGNGEELAQVKFLPQTAIFTYFLPKASNIQRIGIEFYPVESGKSDFENPVIIWADEIPRIP